MAFLKYSQRAIRYYFAPEKQLKTVLQTMSLPCLICRSVPGLRVCSFAVTNGILAQVTSLLVN